MNDSKMLVGYAAIADFWGWEGATGKRRVLYLSQAHGMPVIRSGTGTPVRADPKALRAWVEQKKQEDWKKRGVSF
ncbi:hypothetical protein [Komagataeibacter europaeus]|uniref:hypothetical protein n=1 Tax=Komagataeibacter europaeus TaxID=33995 RepID=UPI0012DE0BD8|nr:hypothetical protein [Komagataeibacter europaeus]